MNRVSNSNIIKTYKGYFRLIIIGVLIIVASFVFLYLGSDQDNKDSENIKYLNELIEKRDEKTGQKAYLNVSAMTDKVVVFDDTTDAYYFVSDGKYYYMVYLKEADAKKYLKMDLSENPIKIVGTSRSIPSDVEKIAIEVYNDYLLSEGEDKLTSDTFFNVFGDIYLDGTSTFSSKSSAFMAIGVMSFLGAIAVILIGVVIVLRFRKNIKSLSDDDLAKIEREMDSQNSFYYSKKKLYLTDNYLVLMDGRFIAYNYKDVLWMYPFEQRYNGVRTNKAIKIFTSDGKTNMIASISIATKREQAIYDEIWNGIVQKNPSIKIGYTPDNIAYFREISKEIKLSKKR